MGGAWKIHYAGGADPKVGAVVSAACGAWGGRWDLAAPVTRDPQSVSCGACRRTYLFRRAGETLSDLVARGEITVRPPADVRGQGGAR